MIITQAHIDFYRAKKAPATALCKYIKPTVFAVRWYKRTDTIDDLINSQVKEPQRNRTEPHNIINFIKGWRSRGEDILTELQRLAFRPYSTDPKRRTAYANKWQARLTQQRKEHHP